MNNIKLLLAISLMFVVSSASAESMVSTQTVHKPGKFDFAVSGPLSLIGGEPHWGPYINVLYNVSSSFQVGIETGFQYWTDSSKEYDNPFAYDISSKIYSIPVIPTFYYRFESDSEFSPFVGLGYGIRFNRFTNSVKATFPGFESKSEFKRDYDTHEMVAHVGAAFGTSKSYFADFRVAAAQTYRAGVSTVFAPTIGCIF